MRKSLHSLLPDPQALLDLEPEELAGTLLEYLNALPKKEQNSLHRCNFFQRNTFSEYGPEYLDEIMQAFMEAWVWLEREGLLVPKPGTQGEWVTISRRGCKLAGASNVDSYRRSNLLPKQILHPKITQKVWATFLRGDYDTAVFQAFKEVEVSVRDAGGFAQEVLGTKLMRKAFDSQNGPLADASIPETEREALAHLFAGAIGSYKNPNSHRNVSINAEDAVEMIMLASHLLKIVDARSRTP